MEVIIAIWSGTPLRALKVLLKGVVSASPWLRAKKVQISSLFSFIFEQFAAFAHSKTKFMDLNLTVLTHPELPELTVRGILDTQELFVLLLVFRHSVLCCPHVKKSHFIFIYEISALHKNRLSDLLPIRRERINLGDGRGSSRKKNNSHCRSANHLHSYN